MGWQFVAAMSAVQALELSNDTISFQARFGGIARNVNIPINAVMAIYAKENGRGMVLVSTSKGVMPGHMAKKQRLGGELILKVY